MQLFGVGTTSSHFLKNTINMQGTALVSYYLAPLTKNISNKKQITMTLIANKDWRDSVNFIDIFSVALIKFEKYFMQIRSLLRQRKGTA